MIQYQYIMNIGFPQTVNMDTSDPKAEIPLENGHHYLTIIREMTDHIQQEVDMTGTGDSNTVATDDSNTIAIEDSNTMAIEDSNTIATEDSSTMTTEDHSFRVRGCAPSRGKRWNNNCTHMCMCSTTQAIQPDVKAGWCVHKGQQMSNEDVQ